MSHQTKTVRGKAISGKRLGIHRKVEAELRKNMGMITVREGNNLNIPENGMAAACP